jgi:hypothetical protein
MNASSPFTASAGAQPVVIAGGGVVGVTLALLLARRRVPTRRARAVARAAASSARTRGEPADSRDPRRGAWHHGGPAAPRRRAERSHQRSALRDHAHGTLLRKRALRASGRRRPRPHARSLAERAAAGAGGDSVRPRRRTTPGRPATRPPLRGGTTGRRPRHGDRAHRVGDLRARGRYLVAADGAGSSVRETLGIGMSGVEEVAAAVSITFAADLLDVVRIRPGVLHWLYGPAQRGTLIAHDPRRLWAYSIKLPPATWT